ncbi:fork-head transcriptional regulator FHL1 [Hyphodiscus hymeniophilus]|uniref:Fork-head transcriptional regulator FHL1 n=1 Tax=Hyphodiscus hymeniophilus TaxID=353542 RepID=A0A9P6VPS3_9HELO|nr:fork-head transcriptional regulator FHL1 [Hyphodiscus hymeniophilus]
MTSPPTTTEVIATMAATGIKDVNPPNLNLTAEMPPLPETYAPATQRGEGREATLPEEHKGKENLGEDVGEEEAHQDADPADAAPVPSHDGLPRDFEANNQDQQIVEDLTQAIRPEDASIPQLNQDSLPDGFVLPDQAQIAGLDALIAMGQMGQLGYNPNLALTQAAGLDIPMLPMPNQENPWLDPADFVPDINRPEDRLVGYAKLVFEDGEFYMNTHSVILGRDPTAHRAAQRREKEEVKRKMEADTPGPRTPVQIKREHMSYSRSVFSEKSGILREGNDSDEETREKRRQKRKASKKSKSTGSSHELSRRNSLAQQPIKPHVYEAQYPSRIKEENAVPVDPASLRPDPNECPLIPLHPSGNAPASAYKSISREHVKIAYNFNKATFEMHVYGRNGAFVNDVYHPQNSTVELKSGNVLQIGQVPLEFVLPDGIIDNGQMQYDDELAADRHSVGGKEMSFDFEEDKRNGVPDDSSPEPLSDDGDEDEDEGEEELEQEGEELEVDEREEGQELSDQEQDQSGFLVEAQEEIEDEEQAAQLESIAPSGKKRGPGRPPKNGIMSAREEREQKAALKAALGNQKAQKSQKSVAQSTSTITPEKKKVGRPRKHDKPDPIEPDKPKRKYTKRKPKEPKDGESKQEGSDGEDQAAKEKKEKKTKPPRSPSPVFIESELTPEQLQKPQANYVTLIYEALSNSKEGKLGLPQIYRAIQRKYPFFVLKVGTVGWQSSVRHNLSQHHAFEKVEKDGKGYLWGIVKGVSIEKEKKRRTPPPPQMGMHQPIYQAGQQHYMGGYPPQHFAPHPGYMPHQMMHGPPQPGHPQHYMGPPPHMNGHPPPPNNQGPPKPINPGLAAAMIPHLTASNRSYSSPYAQTPTPAPAPAPPAEPQRVEQQMSNEQQQPFTHAQPTESPGQQVQPQVNAAQSTQSTQSQPSMSQPSNSQQVPNPPPPPPIQTPQSQPHQGELPAATRQQSPPPPPPPTSNHIPELPQHSQQVIAATERFKENMLQQFKDPKSEEILNSAVNRVLGYTHESSLPGNKYEEGIIKILRSMLERLPGSNIASASVSPSNPDRASTPQTNGQQQPQATTNQSEPQASATSTTQSTKTTGAEKPTPTVMRPTFTGQGQSRPNVPRPPMGTSGMRRTHSGSPALNGSESGQVAGQKRSLDDADDFKDVKRLNGAGMSSLKA